MCVCVCIQGKQRLVAELGEAVSDRPRYVLPLPSLPLSPFFLLYHFLC